LRTVFVASRFVPLDVERIEIVRCRLNGREPARPVRKLKRCQPAERPGVWKGIPGSPLAALKFAGHSRFWDCALLLGELAHGLQIAMPPSRTRPEPGRKNSLSRRPQPC
jgi:hypothetical protein